MRSTPKAKSRDTARKEPARRKRRRARRAAPSPDARFIASADAACAQYLQREEAARKENDGSKEAQIRYLGRVAELLDEVAGDLRALGPAPRSPDTMAQYIAVIERLSGEVRELRDATESFSATYSAKAQRVAKSSSEAKQIARGYGFKVCGSK